MSTIRVICEECDGSGKILHHSDELEQEDCPTCEGFGSRRATHADVESELQRRHDAHLRDSPMPPPEREPKPPWLSFCLGLLGLVLFFWLDVVRRVRGLHQHQCGVGIIVLGVLLGLICWVFIIWTVLTLAGCAPGRQFARTGWIQNGTRDREIVSAGYSVVGRYFPLGEGVKASAYTGTYYDAQGDVPYALIGGRLSWDVGAAGAYSLTLDGYVPEDWEDAEYYINASAEWPWP